MYPTRHIRMTCLEVKHARLLCFLNILAGSDLIES